MALQEREAAVASKACELALAQDQLRAAQTVHDELQKKDYDLKKAQAEREVNDARGQRANVREQIAKAYAAEAEQAKEGKRLSQKIWETQHQRVAGELLFKKLRLEKTQNKRRELQKALENKEAEINTVGAELSRRDGRSDVELQPVLEHADQLKQALQDAEDAGVDLKEQWLRHQNVNTKVASETNSDFRLVDELLALRQRQLQKSSRDKAASLQLLNAQRRDIGKNLVAASWRRKEVAGLISKGGAFLAELELGVIRLQLYGDHAVIIPMPPFILYRKALTGQNGLLNSTIIPMG